MPPYSKSREPEPIYASYMRSDGSWGDFYPVTSRTTERITSQTSTRTRRGNYTAWNPVTHIKCDGKHGLVTAPGGTLRYRDGTNLDYVRIDPIVQYGLSQAYIGLDFIEDNSFELIPFLIDWDDTMAMFSTKFLKEISYGAVNWGVLPFISDLKSLAGSLDAINGKILSSYEKIVGKRITRRFSWEHKFPCPPWFDHHVEGITTLSGYLVGDVVYPDSISRALAVFLDELGINPDIKTLWDIIPLSFVGDYFLPIGDFLESFHPRGWFNPTFSFSGGYSITASVDERYSYGYSGGGLTYKLYVRSGKANLSLPSRPPVQPEFSSPSFRELFNTYYVSRKK